MRYGLASLLLLVTIAAIAFAFVPRTSPVVTSLRRDLDIPTHFPMWVLDESKPDRAIAIVGRDGNFKLFAAYRGWWDDSRRNDWVIPFAVGSGAPSGVPEAIFEDSVEFDHFPTDTEIASFCKAYRIEGFP